LKCRMQNAKCKIKAEVRIVYLTTSPVIARAAKSEAAARGNLREPMK